MDETLKTIMIIEDDNDVSVTFSKHNMADSKWQYMEKLLNDLKSNKKVELVDSLIQAMELQIQNNKFNR